jgi:hypothetical protein
METEITFVGGRVETFDESSGIRLTDHGVEVVSRSEEGGSIRVLFPWAQIERMTQRGADVSSIYTY